MTVDEFTEISLIKQVELQNIGFLQKEPTLLQCPACEEEAFSVVRLEVATRWQRFLALTHLCQKSDSSHDINHYCSHCGCYIGRYVPVGRMERCISRQARKKAAHDAMTLKTKPKDCAAHMQQARDRVKERMAKEKEEEQQPQPQTQQS